MPSPSFRFTPGTSIDRYEVVRVIASGGGGTVVEAIDGSLRRHVAVKVLHITDPAGPEPRRVERFLREVRIAAQIRHPHVVDVLDVGVTDGVPFLVMELVDGDTLEQLVAEQGRLPLGRIVEIVLPLLSAVVELHDNGVVHRDLKPANVLMGPGPALWPKLADFGVASWDGDADASLLTQAGTLIGTPEYLAPEIIREGGRGTERSDIYSLGVLLYECATGRKPFSGATMYERLDAAVRAPVAPPSAHAPSLPPAFDALVARALHRDPAQRFASARDLAEALLAFAPQAVAARWAAEFVPAPSVSAPQSARVETRKTRRPQGRAAGRESTRPARIQTFDGVALSTRGDVLSMVWQSSARLPRTRWTFDCIDRFAAETGGSFLVFMITLPSANPPDAQARQENDRRIATVANRVRKFATVVTGDGMWQVLIRGVIRAMVLPYRSLAGNGASTLDASVDGGIRSLLGAAGPRTPSSERIFADVQALYAALGEEPPARDEARRNRSGIALRSGGASAGPKGVRKPARSA